MQQAFGCLVLIGFILAPVLYVALSDNRSDVNWYQIALFYLLVALGAAFVFSRKGGRGD
jgi:hypothetical protein